jgi:hypothetical protein
VEFHLIADGMTRDATFTKALRRIIFAQPDHALYELIE